MCDEPKRPGATSRTHPDGTPLTEIARALGVPVSRFFVPDTDEAALKDQPDAASVLAVVRSYLMRASPEARLRFVAEVRAIAESQTR